MCIIIASYLIIPVAQITIELVIKHYLLYSYSFNIIVKMENEKIEARIISNEQYEIFFVF